jgi:hypothetical protein
MLMWADEYAVPEESAWGVLQKLAWLNACHPAEALHVLLDRRVSLPTLRYNPRSLLDGAWLQAHLEPRVAPMPGQEDVRGHAPLRHRLYAATGSGTFGKLAGQLLAADLRACDQCLAQGLHLQVHQVAGARTCPLHGSPVTYECGRCGAPRGGWTNAGQEGGFRCMSCGECWLAEDYLKPARELDLAAIDRRVAPLMAWLRQAWTELMRVGEVRRLDAVPDQTPTLQPLFLPEAGLGLCVRVRPYADVSIVTPLRISGVACLNVNGSVHAAAAEASLSRHDVVRRGRERMQATLHGELMRHAPCLARIGNIMRMSSYSSMRCISVNRRACIFAQAYQLWWERVEMLLKWFEDGPVTPVWRGLVPICLRSSFHAAVLELDTLRQSTPECEYQEQELDLWPDPWLQWLGQQEPDEYQGSTRVLRMDLGAHLAELHCDRGAIARERVLRMHQMMSEMRRRQAQERANTSSTAQEPSA